QFVAEHIDTIAAAPVTTDLGRGKPSGSYVTRSICTAYACALNFPGDIQPDWADAVAAFLDWWRVELNLTYGVGRETTGQAADWWPAEAKLAHAKILKAQDRLLVIRTGLTPEE